MMVEAIERRALGALSFVSATTGARILTPLRVTADGVRCVRNPSGLYVVVDVSGLHALTTQFRDQLPNPPVGSVKIDFQVHDPGGEYLARGVRLDLPRDAVPLHVDQPASLFQPVEVRLYPSPAAAIGPGWAVVRASIAAAVTARPLAGALLRVSKASDGTLLASGVSDMRGEALVAVPGLPVFTFDQGAGPVLASQIDVLLQTVFDPGAGEPVDPDRLEAGRATLPSSSTAVRLASGQILAMNLSVPLP